MSDVILLDGGMGQELIARTKHPLHPMWSAEVLRVEPEIVREVHEEYIRAGARVITVNAYSVTRPRLDNYGDSTLFETLQQTACRLAHEARDAVGVEGVAIAGCLPPLPGSYRPDLALPEEEAFEQYSEIVAQQAPHVDLFIAETMGAGIEAKAAARAIAASGKPGWIAWTLEDGGVAHLRSGESLTDAAAMLDGIEVAARLVNCCFPESVDAALPALRATGKVWGAYANGFTSIKALEIGGTVGGLKARQDLGPEAYADFAMRWVGAGATIIGGCCEIGPAHIAELARRLAADEHRIVSGVAA